MDILMPDMINELSNIDLTNKLRVKKVKNNLKLEQFKDKKYNINGFKVKVDELTEYRALIGLPSLRLKVRQCLRCFNKFHSVGNGNRMCEECK